MHCCAHVYARQSKNPTTRIVHYANVALLHTLQEEINAAESELAVKDEVCGKYPRHESVSLALLSCVFTFFDHAPLPPPILSRSSRKITMKTASFISLQVIALLAKKLDRRGHATPQGTSYVVRRPWSQVHTCSVAL